MALAIAKGVMNNQARIVYGNQSTTTHWASKLLPLEWLSKQTAKEMLALPMIDDYTVDHEGFCIPKSDKNTKDGL